MFRYDRPQAGRFRQFWQWDVEAIGDAGPAIDAEIIELGFRFYREAGLADVEVHAQLDRRSGLPAGLHRACSRPTTRRRRRACRTSSARGSRRTRCACSTRRTRRWPRSTRARRGSPTTCADRAPSTSPPSGRISTPSASPTGSSPRLVRGLDYYTRTAFEFYPARRGGPAVGAGRGRPLRRPGRAARRPPDAGDRLRARASTASSLALEDGRGRRAAAEPDRSRSSSVPIRPPPSERLRVVTMLRAAGLRARADLGVAQARPAARGRRTRRRPLRGHPGRRAGRRRGPAARPEAGTQRPCPLADLVRELRAPTRATATARPPSPDAASTVG